MKSLPIAQDEQIESMLFGNFFDLLHDYGQDPWSGDFRRFITISRQQLIDYLRLHPEMTVAYLDKWSAATATHDVAVISEDGAEYIVAWMDHGRARSPHRFRDVAEAVAEHVLVRHGSY